VGPREVTPERGCASLDDTNLMFSAPLKQYIETMRASYTQSLETIDMFNLFMSENEIRVEQDAIKGS
jgi:hypothetical protein